MDESYLLCAVRYIELNPVGAKLLRDPAAQPRSSAAAHVDGRENRLVVASPLPEMVGEWREFFGSGLEQTTPRSCVCTREPVDPLGVMISQLAWKESLPEYCVGGNPALKGPPKGIEYGVPELEPIRSTDQSPATSPDFKSQSRHS